MAAVEAESVDMKQLLQLLMMEGDEEDQAMVKRIIDKQRHPGKGNAKAGYRKKSILYPISDIFPRVCSMG